ncbi:MAG: DUF3822 family protein [Sphingobacteriales bacterium]|nr:MAG: DUF3822 family protein [Sphingobacteriales bacterium]
MSEITNSVVNYHAYNVHEGEALQGQVSKIIGIAMPRGFIAAGFSDRGDLLMIRYSDYPKDMPTWVPDFFDHRFAEEPLLGRPDQVFVVYVLSDKNLLVPNAMHDEASAGTWLRKTFFIEDNESVESFQIADEKLQYLFAWPTAIKGLAHRYFPTARIMPLAAYQLTQLYKSVTSIQCMITEDQVSATLYINRTLHWHQVFSYLNAEEIAYKLKHVCKEHGLTTDETDVFYTTAHSGVNQITDQLSQYIPNIRQTEAGVLITNPAWAPTVSLFQRLYTCAL